MIQNPRYRAIFINLLTATGISLIANFNFFLMLWMPAPPGGYRGWMRQFMDSDSILYVNFFFYLIFALLLLTVLTVNIQRMQMRYLNRALICMAISVALYFLAPVFHPREGTMSLLFTRRTLVEPSVLTKVAFTLILSLLYGKIYQLIYQKQSVQLENEQLRNENLQAIYNTLVNQMNPHFFFNSLNSLSMLVREKHNEKALVYIDRLCETFRYVMQSGHEGGTTLEQELEFLNAYKYLLEVRYEGKLFFELDIDEKYLSWTMPSLTIQPLIENVVKHNSITSKRPMMVSIRTDEGRLLVSNPVYPKIHDGEPSGIGLQNLFHRYELLTGKKITVNDNGATFTVELPLTEPGKRIGL